MDELKVLLIAAMEVTEFLKLLLIRPMLEIELSKDLEIRPVLEIYLVTVFLIAPILEIEAEFWPSTTIFAIEVIDRFRVFWIRPIEVMELLNDLEILAMLDMLEVLLTEIRPMDEI